MTIPVCAHIHCIKYSGTNLNACAYQLYPNGPLEDGLMSEGCTLGNCLRHLVQVTNWRKVAKFCRQY